MWSNRKLDHECSGSLPQSLVHTIRHVWSMWGASFIAGWLDGKGLCVSFRASVVFSCGLLVKWDWLLGSSGQKPAGDHYYCWENIAPCHRMGARDTHEYIHANTCIIPYIHEQWHKRNVLFFFCFYFHILWLFDTQREGKLNAHVTCHRRSYSLGGICQRTRALSQVEMSAEAPCFCLFQFGLVDHSRQNIKRITQYILRTVCIKWLIRWKI